MVATRGMVKVKWMGKEKEKNKKGGARNPEGQLIFKLRLCGAQPYREPV